MRVLAAYEVAWLGGTNQVPHLLGLAFSELVARRVVILDGSGWLLPGSTTLPKDAAIVLLWITAEVLDAQPARTGPLWRHRRRNTVSKVSDGVVRAAGRPDYSVHTQGSWLRRNVTEPLAKYSTSNQEYWMQRFIAGPLVAAGLAEPTYQSRWGFPTVSWAPTPRARQLLDDVRKASADLDPERLARMADTDPQAALKQLASLGAALLLMPELFPTAVRIAQRLPATTSGEPTIDGIYLGDLRTVTVDADVGQGERFEGWGGGGGFG